MPRLLTICSSKRRPKRVGDMFDSWLSTHTRGLSDIIVYVSHDDPHIVEYQPFFRRCSHIVGPPRWMPEVLNWVSGQVYPDYDYYQEVNDDHIYRTPGWDERLIRELEEKGNGWGVACPDQNPGVDWFEHEFPSAAVYSGKMIKALGYMHYPKLRNICCDDWVRDMAKGIGRLFFIPEVVIEHMHHFAGKAEPDHNLNAIYNEEEWANGMREYKFWKENVQAQEHDRLVMAMQKDGVKCP